MTSIIVFIPGFAKLIEFIWEKYYAASYVVIRCFIKVVSIEMISAYFTMVRSFYFYH